MSGERKRMVAKYDYADEQGKLLYQVVRFEPKGFAQRRPTVDNPGDNDSDWVWHLGQTRRVLFGLPALESNNKAKKPRAVWIVEGEKDALALMAIDLLATTCAGGAEKWRDEFSDALKDRRCYVIPDNDAPGMAHAEQVAKSLEGKAESVKIVKLPGMGPGEDVSDWLSRGGTRQGLIDLALDTQKEPPKDNAKSELVRKAEELLELARRLA